MSSKNFDYWDQLMASRNPDYATLCNQMLAIAHSMVSADAELLWRLAAATFGRTYSMDFAAQRTEIKTKTIEAKQYAEKALKVDPNNFGANLWMAKCLGQLAVLSVNNLKESLAILGPLVNHLAVVTAARPDDWRVLLLDSQFQVQLQKQPNTLRAIRSHLPPNLKLLDMATVEGKLRRVLEQKPDSHEAYLALTSALYLQGKYQEALDIGEQGLTLQPFNRAEEFVARTLESFLPNIANKMNGQ